MANSDQNQSQPGRSVSTISRQPAGPRRAGVEAWAPWILLLAGALLLDLALFAGAIWLQSSKLDDEMRLPLLAITGVIGLLGALALVSFGFAAMGMSDRNEALGLPSGSVRAVIALSLIVLFGIFSVFLFSSLHRSGRVQVMTCLSLAEKNMFVDNMPSGQIVLIKEMSPSAAADCKLSLTAGTVSPEGQRSAGTPGVNPLPATLYAVYYRELTNPASEDLAKQLLVLVGTLVTSVAGFYFGTRAVTDAQAIDVSGPPKLTGVSPGSVPRGGSGAVTLQIAGTDLNSVTQARISSGNVQLSGTNVVSNSGQVQGSFTIPASAPVGHWDVSVSDASGRSDTLRGGLVVTDPQTPAAIAPGIAAAGPTLTGLDPPTIVRGGGPATITAKGANLSQIGSATIVSADRHYEASHVAANADTLQAVFNLPDDVPLGRWDFVVADRASRIARLSDALSVIDPEPQITKIDLPSIMSDNQPHLLTISGSNLTSINQVAITLGTTVISGQNVLSNATAVQASFTVPAGTASGKADVTVSDDAGHSAKLSQVLDITT